MPRKAFASRVAASLRHAVGPPEIAVATAQRYEASAVELAHDAGLLARRRAGIEAARIDSPLFDTPRLTRHLEAADAEMHRCHAAGLLPRHPSIAG